MSKEDTTSFAISSSDATSALQVLMLGAWLGQDQLFMVVELLSTDLYRALHDPSMQEDLRWDNRWA